METAMANWYEAGRAHASVYRDPEVFALERERLFKVAWIYVGHESQVERPGDYLRSELVDEPILLVRGADGEVRGFFNRCPHRGALIAREARGNAKLLQCAYHGWSFRHDGALQSIPYEEGYAGTDLGGQREAWGLTPLPRFASYRGFLFASLAAEGPDLESYLGPVAINLDNMVERSPLGKIAVWGSRFSIVKRNNWKVYLENLHDGAHALPTHVSSIRAAQQAIEQAPDEWTRLRAYIMAANAQSPKDMAQLPVQCYPNGHSDMSAFRKTRSDTPGQREYEEALARRYGRDGVERILGVDRNNAIIYPTLTVQPNWMQLRLLVPLDVETTRVDIWIFKILGAPEWIQQRIRAFTNTIHTPGSLVRADDLENFERVQLGLRARSVSGINVLREFTAEPAGPGPSTAMSERYVRNQLETWMRYMKEER